MPGLRTLDKYILGKFLRTYIFGILMMIIILVVFDYVEKVDDFTELKAPMKEIIWDYYMNFIPQFVSQFSALFTFIAVIFFTSKMAMQTEIVAILSGGVSFRRFMWPYIVGATLITAMSLVLSLWIIPEGQKASVEFQSKYLKSQQLVEYDDHVYRQIEDDTYAYVRGFSPGMERVPFFAIERFEGAELVETLDAANATFDVESQRWTAPRYMIYSRGEDGTLGGKQYRNLDTLINLDVRELGDISGGNAERFSSLSLVFGQVSASGKLMGQDLLQFINAGFNPLKELEAMTGKSYKELQELMSKGEITFDHVAAAMAHATGEGGKFHGMMEKQSQTLGGRWSTMVDTIQQKALSLFDKIAEPLKGLLDIVNMIIPPIASVFEFLFTVIGGVINFILKFKTTG